MPDQKLHEPECDCRKCRLETRQLDRAMGTTRTYSKGRMLNQDEKDQIKAQKSAERLSQGKRLFDFYS